MANNTLDKAIEAIPYFGKRIKLFTKKMGMAHVVICLNVFLLPRVLLPYHCFACLL